MTVTHAPATPDVEALVWALLSPLGGIHVAAYDAQTEWPHVTDRVALTVSVKASSKERARDRAYEARQMCLRLPFDATSQVVQVEVIGGPLFVPDDDGAPRYVTRIAVTVRATRG